jgi:hypothetical protein
MYRGAGAKQSEVESVPGSRPFAPQILRFSAFRRKRAGIGRNCDQRTFCLN